MILPDVNPLIYAFRSDVPQHAVSRAQLCIESDACGFRVSDVWHAALAIAWDCEWITFDRDVARFPRLKWRTPAAGEG